MLGGMAIGLSWGLSFMFLWDRPDLGVELVSSYVWGRNSGVIIGSVVFAIDLIRFGLSGARPLVVRTPTRRETVANILFIALAVALMEGLATTQSIGVRSPQLVIGNALFCGLSTRLVFGLRRDRLVLENDIPLSRHCVGHGRKLLRTTRLGAVVGLVFGMLLGLLTAFRYIGTFRVQWMTVMVVGLVFVLPGATLGLLLGGLSTKSVQRSRLLAIMAFGPHYATLP